MKKTNITNLLNEHRLFQPPKEFACQSHVPSLQAYKDIYDESIRDPQGFWQDQAHSLLKWQRPFTKVLEWNAPYARWFSDGKINASYNCLDRHLAVHPNKDAIIWEGEPQDEIRRITYAELHKDVCVFANALKKLGMKTGDVATIYMPMVPEIAVAMLACARLGITHSVIFAGFSADAIAERSNDCKAKLIITANGSYRRGQKLTLKTSVDEALEKTTTVEKVIVLRRTEDHVPMLTKRDHWWHDLVATVDSAECEPVELDAEHPLFLLYTSGSTGKPKGILHTTAGYLLGATLSFQYVFDLKPNDIYWCTADVGWVTGHSYVVYGPLASGATVLMYEGAPNFPTFHRFWQIIERYKVSIFYTAPTAIRAFMKAGDEFPKNHDLSSLRLLGTVGEPINPEAWMWYHQTIGSEKCPIVDTWWQTETGSIMIAPLPGAVATIPGTATLPFFGIEVDVVDKDGKSVKENEGGFLVIKKPWPSMLRTIYGDDERYKSTYWSQIPGMYFTGDGARKDEHGYIWIMGRIDDVLNVSGHRLSTMEIESAIVSFPGVAEAAVVGAPHEVKGEAIFAFVTPKTGTNSTPEFAQAIKAHVAKQIGALARPDAIHFTEALPKTRSGKIIRRLLRDIAAGRDLKGDTTTLEDQSILEKLRESEQS